jgi:DNA-binding MarR family transcriptional regulator
MITSTTSTDPLVEVLATRLRRIDLVAWQRIAAWAEESELSLEDLRLLLACIVKSEDGPTPISELAEMAGFPLEVAYPVIHRLRGRGYLVEARRRYSLSPQGEELAATLDAVHREGIQTYVDEIGPEERKRLDAAFEIEE